MACGTISGVTPTYVVVLPEGALAHLFNPNSKTYGKRQNTTENPTKILSNENISGVKKEQPCAKNALLKKV